jgi:hypothetical protein
MPATIAHTRLFVALTLAEAAAIGRLTSGIDPDAISAVEKIRTALAGVTTPLRSKYYVAPPPAVAPEPRAPKLRMATVDPPRRRMAKAVWAAPRPTSASRELAPLPDDDYVPFRDEADGIYNT